MPSKPQPKGFTCFNKFGDSLSNLPEGVAKELAYAIVMYGTKGIKPDLPEIAAWAWPMFKDDIDNSVSNRTRNPGGRPAENPGSPDGKTQVPQKENPGSPDGKTQVPQKENPIQSNPDQTSTDQSNPDQTKPEKKRRFAPPSPIEVGEYAREKGLNLDPNAFCDFYASKGWKVGKDPMKDWKAAARNWSRREAPGSAPPPDLFTPEAHKLAREMNISVSEAQIYVDYQKGGVNG